MARPRTDIRPRIVRAALTRFLKEGVDGASLRNIAKDAGTNIGMVFYYFPEKDDLFLAVVEEVYSALVGDLKALLAPDLPPKERLRRAFERLGSASQEELDVIRLVIREALLSSARFQKVFARAERGHLPMILETLREAFEKGDIDPSLPLPVVLACTLGLGALPQLLRRGVGDHMPLSGLPPAGELAALSVNLLFRAIGPDHSHR